MQAFLVDTPEGAVDFVGNSTECALLMLMRSWGEDYEKVRKANEKNVVKVSRRRGGRCLMGPGSAAACTLLQ